MRIFVNFPHLPFKLDNFVGSEKGITLRESVQIRSFLWSLFSCISTEYGDLRSIQSEYKKMRSRKNSLFGHFLRSVNMQKSNSCKYIVKEKKWFVFFDGLRDCPYLFQKQSAVTFWSGKCLSLYFPKWNLFHHSNTFHHPFLWIITVGMQKQCFADVLQNRCS